MSGGGDDFPEEHEEHVNHEAWVIPYADLLTLLMAMFIALFAMSTVDTSKFKALALGFNEALGGGKLDAGIGGSGKATSPVVGSGQGQGPFGGSTLMPSTQTVNSTELTKILAAINTNKSTAKAQQQTLDDLKKQIDNAAAAKGLGSLVSTKPLKNGLKVTLLTDQVLFAKGGATLQPDGVKLLTVIGGLLNTVNNPLNITGYTDSDPINTAQFPSNDELSFSRALSVKRFLVSLGVPIARISATGDGPEFPAFPNDTEAHKAGNRRVEIIVLSNAVKQTLDQAGLDGTPAVKTPTTAAANPSVNGARPNLSPGLGAG